jgi:nitrogen fixation protein NifX
MAAPLSEEVALRIGLAARVLPDVEPRLLLRALLDVMGEPITATKLSRLRAQRLRAAGGDAFAAVEADVLQQAVAFLKGQGIEPVAEPLPPIEPIAADEMRNAVRVACSSNSGERIDGHFGSCARFLIYRVSPERIALVEIREPETPPEDVDRNAYRAELLSDCSVLYTISIGGPAAAKVVRAGLHPMKLQEPVHAREALSELQQVLRGANPPPWLQKAMGVLPRVRAYSVESY